MGDGRGVVGTQENHPGIRREGISTEKNREAGR